jgi:hypothetical protein
MADDFQLFTSLRYDPLLLEVPARGLEHAGWNYANKSALYMLDYHRDRMLRAATHWSWDAAVRALEGESGLKHLEETVLNHVGDRQQQSPLRVRVAINRDGEMSVISGPVPELTLGNLFPARLPSPDGDQDSEVEANIPSTSPAFQVLVDGPETNRSEFTHFKTTKREAYDSARQRAQLNLADKKEVLIVNKTDGSVMEGSLTTVYFWRDGKWVTPAVSPEYSQLKGSGGQNGTSRRWALERYVYRPSITCSGI